VNPKNLVVVFIIGVTVSTIGSGGCSQKSPEPNPVSSAPPREGLAPGPSTPGALRLAVKGDSTATFLIDAPLEKIKGRARHVRGTLDVDPNDVSKTRGEVDVDLVSLETQTFDDPARNASQTEHAHNWMELGAETNLLEREANRWAKLTIQSLEIAGPTRLADIPASGGARVVNATVHGSVWIHGVAAPATVRVAATFSTDASGATSVHVTSSSPLTVSLRKHDIKPRDLAGRFLEGALEKTGKKIDDTVQISVDLTASSAS